MSELRVREEVLLPYMTRAPLALAFERSLEASIYRRLRFPRPVLDIGCGDGLFASVVFADPIDTGIDPDPLELARARRLGAYQELLRCPGDAVPKPDGFYRTIVSNSVLEHIPEMREVLREALRLLAPGGRFYLTVPTDRFERYTILSELLSACGLRRAAAAFRRRFNAFWRHHHCYSLAEWRAQAERSGFSVVESFTYDPRRVCLLNDLLAPLGAPAFLLKRLADRWTLLPGARRVLLYPAYLGARRFLRGGDRDDEGGLAFLALAREGRT